MARPEVDHCLQTLGRWLLPWRCLVCRERGEAGDLCAACRAELPVATAACARCARPLSAAVAACGPCLRAPPPWAAAHAAFGYGFPLDRLLPRFKFHGDLAAGRVLADLWCARMAGGSGNGGRGASGGSEVSRDGVLLNVLREGAIATHVPPTSAVPRLQALVPVPLHATRLRERGYDQALELARRLGLACGLPVRADALWRPRATARQSDLAAGARRGNVAGAFAIRGPPLPSHVALVDDVMTTGATLRACTQALRAAGVKRVDVWVLARADGPS